MSKKVNMFYVWGYGGAPDSTTVTNLKDLLGKDYNVVSDYYAQYNPEEAIKDINYYIEHYKVDILVGSSLGGYLALQIPGIKKVIINPCLYPNIELPLLKDDDGNEAVPSHIVDFYEKYISEHNVWENFNNEETVFVMGNNDELLGMKYFDEISEHSNKIKISEQGHHNTLNSLREYVVPVIKSL